MNWREPPFERQCSEVASFISQIKADKLYCINAASGELLYGQNYKVERIKLTYEHAGTKLERPVYVYNHRHFN